MALVRCVTIVLQGWKLVGRCSVPGVYLKKDALPHVGCAGLQLIRLHPLLFRPNATVPEYQVPYRRRHLLFPLLHSPDTTTVLLI